MRLWRRWTKNATEVTFRFADLKEATAWCEDNCRGRIKLQSGRFDNGFAFSGVLQLLDVKLCLHHCDRHDVSRSNLILIMMFEEAKEAMMFKLVFGCPAVRSMGELRVA